MSRFRLWLALGAAISFAALGSNVPARAAAPSTQCITNALAGGTINAITVPLLPCALSTSLLLLTLQGANTSANPTLQMAGYPAQAILTADGTTPGVGALGGAGSVVLLTSTGKAWLIVGGSYTGGVTGDVSGPGSSVVGDVPTFNNTVGTVINDNGVLNVNTLANDGQAGGLDGNAIGLWKPTFGLDVNSRYHSVGTFSYPQIGTMNDDSTFNAAFNMKWGTGATGGSPVPSGTKGALVGYECNIATAQSSSDILNGFDADHCFGATITNTGSVYMRGLDMSLVCTSCSGNSDNVGTALSLNSGASGVKKGFVFNNIDAGSSATVLGFSAEATGSRAGAAAFVAQGSAGWSVSFQDQPISSANEQSTFQRFVTVGDYTATNPLAIIGNTGSGVVVVGAFSNHTVDFRQNNVKAGGIDPAGGWNFGKNDGTASPTSVGLRAPNGVGTNITGATLSFLAGNGTGSGGSGAILFQVAPVGSTGTSADSLVTALTIGNTKDALFAGQLTVTGHVTFEGVTATGATGTGNLVFSASPTFTGTLTAPTINATTGFSANGSAGASQTCTVEMTGTLIFSHGILTGGTCNM